MQLSAEGVEINTEMQELTDRDRADEIGGRVTALRGAPVERVATKDTPSESKGVTRRDSESRGKLSGKREFFEERHRNAACHSLPASRENVWVESREQVSQRLAVDGENVSCGGGSDSAQYILL